MITRAESQLHSLEQVAGSIADKTEYVCLIFLKKDISTLNGSSLKLLDKFPYLGSSVSLSENDINMRLVIDHIEVRLINKIKRSFFKAAVVSILLYGFVWFLCLITYQPFLVI